jgi:glycosyltransferase involved in cell wall biosynthesis
MVSVIIATRESERALLPTLAALVSGAAAGLVREVIIGDAGSHDETAAIADVAGCHLIVTPGSAGARMKQAAMRARAAWLLFLHPGTIPQGAWIAELRAFIDEAERRPDAHSAATFRLLPEYDGGRFSLAERLALIAGALRLSAPPGAGLLIAKNLYESLGGHRDAEDAERDLLQRVGRRRLVTLHCGASLVRH